MSTKKADIKSLRLTKVETIGGKRYMYGYNRSQKIAHINI